ncbi:hypothetical protein BT96DRAFT_941592 [Gymnopus androsaceus JB14]|uniref:Uncharacterized protein n=1 Tax=Gymnopus androsaceus JB14 TaxID=1447944 RepID=A0A6A4HHL2_9AGAR|nr:hypothetical protein BT96DRAFT_941592 [Gymnopus androsaceus JB14]
MLKIVGLYSLRNVNPDDKGVLELDIKTCHQLETKAGLISDRVASSGTRLGRRFLDCPLRFFLARGTVGVATIPLDITAFNGLTSDYPFFAATAVSAHGSTNDFATGSYN